MSSNQMPPGGSDPRLHQRLGELINDAVGAVEPSDRLDQIRNETKVTTMNNRRPWLYGVTGAVVATAATITAIALLGNSADPSSDPGPASSSPSALVDESESPEPTDGPTDNSSTQGDDGDTGTERGGPLPVYYVGDGPRGPVLFREFQFVEVGAGVEFVEAAVAAAVVADPQDPDYRTVWPDYAYVDEFKPADVEGDRITVRLTSKGGSLRERPSGMNAREAELAIQQIVYTAQGALGKGRLPVQILLNGKRSDTVLGVPTAEPLAHASALETLSLMNISSLREGQTVTGKFKVTGVNNGFEAWAGWEIINADGESVRDGFTTADGAYDDKLFTWTFDVDVTGLTSGTYTFRAHNDDPSDGEGGGPAEDTRTIVIK